jgi:hypothetical protein
LHTKTQKLGAMIGKFRDWRCSTCIKIYNLDTAWCTNVSLCSAELISTAYQPWNSVFLSQQISHSRFINKKTACGLWGSILASLLWLQLFFFHMLCVGIGSREISLWRVSWKYLTDLDQESYINLHFFKFFFFLSLSPFRFFTFLCGAEVTPYLQVGSSTLCLALA